MPSIRRDELTIDEGTEYYYFGVSDNKGRTVGCIVSFTVAVYEAAPAGATYWNNVEPGTYFTWLGFATRGGETFGASPVRHLCKTEAERHAAVEKYLKGAKARALKTWS